MEICPFLWCKKDCCFDVIQEHYFAVHSCCRFLENLCKWLKLFGKTWRESTVFDERPVQNCRLRWFCAFRDLPNWWRIHNRDRTLRIHCWWWVVPTGRSSDWNQALRRLCQRQLWRTTQSCVWDQTLRELFQWRVWHATQRGVWDRSLRELFQWRVWHATQSGVWERDLRELFQWRVWHLRRRCVWDHTPREFFSWRMWITNRSCNWNCTVWTFQRVLEQRIVVQNLSQFRHEWLECCHTARVCWIQRNSVNRVTKHTGWDRQWAARGSRVGRRCRRRRSAVRVWRREHNNRSFPGWLQV